MLFGSYLGNLSTDETQVLAIESAATEAVSLCNTTNQQDSIMQTSNSLPPYEVAGSISDQEYQSGILLFLQQKHFLPFAALSFVKFAMDEMCDRKLR